MQVKLTEGLYRLESTPIPASTHKKGVFLVQNHTHHYSAVDLCNRVKKKCLDNPQCIQLCLCNKEMNIWHNLLAHSYSLVCA